MLLCERTLDVVEFCYVIQLELGTQWLEEIAKAPRDVANNFNKKDTRPDRSPIDPSQY